ncbi:hypothetical protein LVW35_27620 [Pseudomonas sp. HN11]|uniref:hypothetical protein n=1 Tax=Pseudomonas sp. HN11 TaxID=1344094 RepID=UPI001F27DB14|nr:hypothetical protein [Pseudomonas sp. HN11]UII71355.1 hypothetical protein LVW35_27620 [Pseudomonas sp. HN11]
MVGKLKGAALLLFCSMWLTQGVQAQNCRLSVSQSRIDYGVIRREAFVESPSVALGTRTMQLSVTCAEPSVMALRFIAAADGQGFRFGRQGRFKLRLKHALVDGRAVAWEVAQRPGEAASGQFLPGQILVAHATGMPVPGHRLTAQVEVETDLPSDALQVRNETRLEGQGTFELVSPIAPPTR